MESAINRTLFGERPCDAIDAGKRRRLLFKPPEKPVEIRRPAPCADHDAFGIVPHITGKPAIARQAPNRGTKTDALHDTADAQADRAAPRELIRR